MFSVNGQYFKLDDETVLERVIRSGYSMPYNCRDGRCKNCEIVDQNTGNSFLACQTHPVEGQKFICENFEDFKLPDIRQLPMKVIEVQKIGNFYYKKQI